MSLEGIYYDLHYERVSWDELSAATHGKLFAKTASQNEEDKYWSRMILSEAIRTNPELFLEEMPVNLRTEFLRPYLLWGGAESLNQINPEQWPNVQNPAKIRKEALEIAKQLGEPEQLVLALRDEEIRAPEHYEILIKAVTCCEQAYLKPLGAKIPHELYAQDKRLGEIMLQRGLADSLSKEAPEPVEQENMPQDDLVSTESQASRTILLHCDGQGKSQLWQIAPGQFDTAFQALTPSELSAAESRALASAKSKHSLSLIRGAQGLWFKITEAATALKKFCQIPAQKLLDKLNGSEEAENVLAKSELLAAYAAAHFLTVSSQGHLEANLKRFIPNNKDFHLAEEKINATLEDVVNFYQKAGQTDDLVPLAELRLLTLNPQQPAPKQVNKDVPISVPTLSPAP